MRESGDMERRLYTVSEAVQRCGVPSHVLRYWEDELQLPIARTTQGHRVYCEEDLETFAKVKELKEKGIQLKAIRLLLENSEGGYDLGILLKQDLDGRDEKAGFMRGECREAEFNRKREEKDESDQVAESDAEEADYEIIPVAEADNYQRFEAMLRNLIGEVVSEQNERLERTISERLHEEIEDLYIQLQQEGLREAAAAAERPPSGERKEGIMQNIKRLFRIK